MRIQTKLSLILALICAPLFAEFGGSGAMMGAAGTSSLVGISSLTYRMIRQRTAGSCALPIVGTYTGGGTATIVKASATVLNGGTAVGLTTVDAAPVANAFTGTLSVVSGWYSINVQAFNGASLLGQTTIGKVGCGDNYVVIGQSLSANNNQTQTAATDDRVEMTGNPFSWSVASDPMPIASGTGGSVWSLMGGLMVAHTNAPISFINLAIGGSVVCTTTVPSWNLSASPTLYDTLKSAVLMYGRTEIKSILLGHGETDTVNGCSNAAFAAAWEAVFAQLATDVGGTVPVVVALETAAGNTGTTLVRGGEAQIVTDLAYAHTGPDIDLVPVGERYDGVHLNLTGQTNSATRWYNALVSVFSL